MNEQERTFKQKIVTCPIDGDAAKFAGLACMGNANYRMYCCVGNKEHICYIDEEIFWNDKA